jgi:hypothetical protein
MTPSQTPNPKTPIVLQTPITSGKNISIPATPLEISIIVEELNTQDVLIDAEAALLLSAPVMLSTPHIPPPNANAEINETVISDFTKVDEEIDVKTGIFDTPPQDISTVVEYLNSQGVMIDESDHELLSPINCLPPQCDPPDTPKVSLNNDESMADLQLDVFSTPLPHTTVLSQDTISHPEEDGSSTAKPQAKNNDDERATRRTRRTATYNEDQLSELATSSQGGEGSDQTGNVCNFSVLKDTRKIQEDVTDNKFTSKSEKPRGKSANLKVEVPTHGVYARKSGFTTERPLHWAEALEKYIENNNIHHRWDYLCDSDDVYQECRVKIFPQSPSTKKILVEIKISSGVIHISGNDYQEWITETFNSWSELLNNDLPNQLPPPLLTTATTSSPPPLPPQLPKAKETHKENDQDRVNEMKQLWEEQTKLKTSMSTLESSIMELRGDLQKLTETVETKLSEERDIRKDTRDELDNKVVGFLESANETCQLIVRRMELKLMGEMDKLKTQATAQESRLQSQLDGVKNSINTNKTPDNSQNSLPKWTDLEHVSNLCKQSNTTTMTEIESLRQSLHTHKEHYDMQLSTLQPVTTVQPATIVQPVTTVETPKPQEEEQTGKKKIVILTDSNGKRLNQKKFCHPVPLKDVTWEIRYTLKDIHDALNSLCNVEMDMLVICCGTNDTDKRSGQEVANELGQIVNRIKVEHPHTKLVISEATPRQYHRDQEIKICNQILHEQLDQMPGVAVAVQSGLRDGNWTLYDDDKHIKREKINIYAGNIKSAMREVRTGRSQSDITPEPHMRNSNNRSRATPNNTNRNNFTNTTQTSNYTNSTTTSHNSAPHLMSVAPPSWPHYNNFNNNAHPRFSRPIPSGVPPTGPPMRSPIQNRLMNIAGNQHRPTGNKIRDSLLGKLSEMVKCLQDQEW